MVDLPRLVIADLSTGQGKTTIATGLMAALRAAGHEVSGHKAGPDYIDPGYHVLATGRPGRNLDPHLVGEERIVPLLLHGAAGADVALIEGVMGLHDGRLGTDGFASTAHVAVLTATPAVLVVDVARQSRTAAAVAAGLASFDAAVRVAGVVLNRAGSARMTPRSPAPAEPWDPRAEVCPANPWRPVVAMAGGRAFTFRYAETEELLRAAGCEVVAFDPVTDTALPEGTQGIYLGGGFPEVFAAELAANQPLLADLRAAVAAGTPAVAECSGLLHLASSLDEAAVAGVIPAAAVMTSRLTLRYPEAAAACDSVLTRAGERVTGHEFHRTQTVPAAGARPAWQIDGQPAGFTAATMHASYLHVHWSGYPRLAQRLADAVHAAPPHASEPAAVTSLAGPPTGGPPARDPLRHHGDSEAGHGYLDFAVNVFSGVRPSWLDHALHAAVDQSAAYPDAAPAHAAIARHHGRNLDEVLATAGAADAFTLIARLRPWRKPVVVHPQFTEPHAALQQAGHAVTTVLCRAEEDFALDPAAVPGDADLVVIGNPTNPTGVLHPAALICQLLRPGRLVVIDEAFMDAVPDEAESLVRDNDDGLLVIRSLTKHWSIPGIRAGYVTGAASVIASLSATQTPWSVCTPAIAATVACTGTDATTEARERALTLGRWRDHLQAGLGERSVGYVASSASYVLARLGEGTREALRVSGIAVRRCDTFPGLDASWARIAVRPPAMTDRLLLALDQTRLPQPAH